MLQETGFATGSPPIAGDAASLDSTSELWRPIVASAVDRPFVVAQLGQSLDGRIATVTGDSCYINGSPALDHLHRLRANVDAIVVGVGTVLSDDPQLTVRRVRGNNPARVVIDPRGRLPCAARCMRDDGARRVLVRIGGGEAPPGVELLRLDGGPDALISPMAILEELLRLGLRRVLLEGGSRTISSFMDAGCVDRLHVLVAPMILGSGKPGLELRPIGRLGDALRPVTQVYPLGGGEVLFDCDLRSCMRGKDT